jgi:hypothetical protein
LLDPTGFSGRIVLFRLRSNTPEADLPRAALLLLAVAVVVCLPGLRAEDSVKGKWFPERDKALAEAQKLKKPVLAVAMDHA